MFELTDIQVKAVFDMIFGPTASVGLVVNEEDRAKAYSLLDELVRRSCQRSWTPFIPANAERYDLIIQNPVNTIIRKYTWTCLLDRRDSRYSVWIRDQISVSWRSFFETRKIEGYW